MNKSFLDFGQPRQRHFMNDEYEDFTKDVNFKFDVIQHYLFELSSFYDKQSKISLEDYKDLEKSDIENVSMNDPKYALYTGEFQRITISNIYVSLFSYFEHSLMDFITQLEHYFKVDEYKKRVNNGRFKKKSNKKTIIEMGYYLSNFYKKPNDIAKDIELFTDPIEIRNAIVHNGSRIKKSEKTRLNLYFEIIYYEHSGNFELKDMISCLHTVKSMRTFYNSLHLYKLYYTEKE